MTHQSNARDDREQAVEYIEEAEAIRESVAVVATDPSDRMMVSVGLAQANALVSIANSLEAIAYNTRERYQP